MTEDCTTRAAAGRIPYILAAAMLIAAVTGCEREDWKPEVLAEQSVSEEQSVLRLGREGYATYCVGCHGEQGDGHGPAARFLDPRPRDFRLGIIKFAAVEAGELPHDSDLKRVIRQGLDGTSMPAWRFMPDRTVDAIVQYVKTFAPEAYAQDEPHVEIVATVDPWDGDDAAAIAEGEKIYHLVARCNSCHPSYLTRQELFDMSKKEWGRGQTDFRDDMYQGIVTETDWGDELRAPDFLTATLKNGNDPQTLYRVIVSGVGGTAMPTWRGAFSEEQLWALVHYVRSLSLMKGTGQATALAERLASQPAFQPPAQDADASAAQ